MRYFEVFYSLCGLIGHRQAYEVVEKMYFELVQESKYSTYESFKRNKSIYDNSNINKSRC